MILFVLILTGEVIGMLQVATLIFLWSKPLRSSRSCCQFTGRQFVTHPMIEKDRSLKNFRMKLSVTPIYILLLALVLMSCNEKQPRQVARQNLKDIKEPLIKANQFLLRNEDARIEAFIKRHNWQMQKSNTG